MASRREPLTREQMRAIIKRRNQFIEEMNELLVEVEIELTKARLVLL